MRLGSKTSLLTLLLAAALQFGSAGSAAAQSTAAAEATPPAASQPAPAPAAAAATADPAAANSANAFGIPIYSKTQLMSGTVMPSTFIIGTATTLLDTAGCNFGPVVN